MKARTTSYTLSPSHSAVFQVDLLKQGQHGQNSDQVSLVLDTIFLVELVIIVYTITILCIHITYYARQAHLVI